MTGNGACTSCYGADSEDGLWGEDGFDGVFGLFQAGDEEGGVEVFGNGNAGGIIERYGKGVWGWAIFLFLLVSKSVFESFHCPFRYKE